MLREFLEELGIFQKDFFIVFILLFNIFECTYITPRIIESILSNVNLTYTQNVIIWTAYYGGIVGSSIIGSILSKKINRLNFLYVWLIFGMFSSLSPVLLKTFEVMHILIISILLGVSIGLGTPLCLAYFADCTLIENRGRTAGIIWLIINLSAPLLAFPLRMFNLIVNSIIFATWRGAGLIISFLKPKEKIASETKIKKSFASILHDKSFVLYFTAWFMFLFIDRLERPILTNYLGDLYYFTLGPIIGSVSCFIAGLLSDWIGRKRVVLYGFVAFGIAYAIIGIAPAAWFSRYFFIVIESISSGLLFTIFILILWGDLSQSGIREEYYAIGGIPFSLTQILYRLSIPYVILIPETSSFSVASFFLFLAVLPLLYAPETLPERKIELRQLKKYVGTAEKIRQKYAEKAVKRQKSS